MGREQLEYGDLKDLNPLRFHPSQSEGRHPYAFMAFSAGYHRQSFALNEIKIAIAFLVKQFRFAVDESHHVVLEQQVILVAQNNIELSLDALKIS